jgi:exosortase E/protease (VPEID-CTERM system)
LTRAILLLILLAFEVLIISLSFDAAPQATINHPDSWLTYLAHTGTLARFLSVVAAALLLLAGPRLPAYAGEINAFRRQTSNTIALAALHLLAAVGFFLVTALLFSVPSTLDAADRPAVVGLWLASGAALIGTWALLLAPAASWTNFLRRERFTLLMASLAGLIATTIAFQAQHLWQGLAYGALRLAHGLLQLRYDNVVVDTEQLILGVNDFVVLIGYPCSGYEGIGMISVFTALYLYVFRQEFRFPRALWLFPIGIVSIWLFNVARIAVLIGIGAEISPTLALEGFHSQAGWISFLLVSSVILYLAHRSGFAVRQEAAQERLSWRDNLPAATLLPLLVIVAVGLVTSALAETIDWLYPLRLLAGAAVLLWVWRTLAIGRPWFTVTPIAVGAGVCLLWILLGAPDPEADAAVAEAWQKQAAIVAWPWLLCRLLGAIILAPIAEELVFRGYLLSRLSRMDLVLLGRVRYSWIAVLVSSVLFGVLHDAWLAGTLAGLAYGWLRQHSDSIWSPIVAHAATNALLAAFVISTGNLSFW